jgi:hypothetical protein
VLNIVVLIAVAGSLLTDASWIRSAYGDRTPARDILVAIYLAILLSSAAFLVAVLVAPAPWLVGAVAALLGVQVIYKVLTAVTVRSAFRNPVVLSNLGIAAVHVVTLVTVIVS